MADGRHGADIQISMCFTVDLEPIGFVERRRVRRSHRRAKAAADELQGRPDHKVLAEGLPDACAELIQYQGAKARVCRSPILSVAGSRACRRFGPYFAEPQAVI